MSGPGTRIDTSQLKVYPLAERKSLSRVEDILIDPDSAPPESSESTAQTIAECAQRIRAARERGASVMLIYGAHLLRNGASPIVDRLIEGGWVTHLATNGAGTIHDWEFAYQGRSTECVKSNVAEGKFGAWDETGRNIMVALLAGGAFGWGYGDSLGAFIEGDGTVLPNPAALRTLVADNLQHPLSPARLELAQFMDRHEIAPGRYSVNHDWKESSILAQAFRRGVPLTVHPGIGYDIISCHPMYSGSAVGRAAQIGFESFCGSVMDLDGGVVLSVGSAIMGPQVFEKSLSCVNNLRLQEGREIVSGHSIYVVDLQPGEWDWSQGEPSKDHPAYYLRFCKSYSRMGGEMRYLRDDNAAFIHRLYRELAAA